VAGPAPARASGHIGGLSDSSAAAAIGIPLMLLPGEIGSLLSDKEAAFDLGWSWQMPVTSSFRHRIAGGLDWVPGSHDHRFRGRIGYRFGLRHFFTGIGPAFDHSGATWSPEFGVKFAHSTKIDQQIDFSLHVVVRADIATAVDQFRALTVLFGWNAF
jgi:hypothetical protein